MRPALTRTTVVFRKWLHLPDLDPLYATLGAVAANRMQGDPVWLLLVGAPSSGKSEILGSLSGLPDIHPAATLTEASLLSGTPKREKAKDSTGGLLRAIGDYGIICAKDFGSILSMNRDAQAQVLAALREIYDGAWTRHIGSDGGRTLHWVGKVGLTGGCTPSIDRRHAVVGAMGERLALCRLGVADEAVMARRALEHCGREGEMRAELAAAVSKLFAETDLARAPLSLTENELTQLVNLATLVVRCRSAVERDSYSREVELVPGAEAPGRLIVVLRRLLDGLDLIGLDRANAWRVVRRVGLDSMPALRRKVIDILEQVDASMDTTEIAVSAGYPTQTTRRALEDLVAYAALSRSSGGKGHADSWCLSDWTRDRLAGIGSVPEMRDGESSVTLFINPHRMKEGKTGKVPETGDARWEDL